MRASPAHDARRRPAHGFGVAPGALGELRQIDRLEQRPHHQARSVRAIHAAGVVDRLRDRLRRDMVFDVIRLLKRAPPLGFVNCALHRISHHVAVKDDLGVDVPGGAADGLNQRCLGTQEPLLIGVENRHERDLRQVEAFAQEVDADQHVEGAEAQVTDDLRALHRADIRVKVTDPDLVLREVIGEVFCHALGQNRAQSAIARLSGLANLTHHIVDLIFRRTDFDSNRSAHTC